jgi:hypothetical protein
MQGSGATHMSNDQYSATAAAAVAAAQQQNMSQTLRNQVWSFFTSVHGGSVLCSQSMCLKLSRHADACLQMYSAAEQKQHMYAPVTSAHMMRPNQGHSSQQSSAQVLNYAESVVRAMLLPTAARQQQAQHFSQCGQPQAHPRYNNPAAVGLQMPTHHTPQETVAHGGFAHVQGSGVAPNNFSRFYDAGRMRR